MVINVIKMKDSDEKGLLMIPERPTKYDSMSLNNVLMEDGSVRALMDTQFDMIGEIDDSDSE